MKHLHTLLCIVDVATSGSIRKSAERLSITPSALTRRIQDFEQELGTLLFDRTRKGMRLTFAGDLLVQHARKQTADFDRVRTQIADLSSLRRGQIAFVCSQAFIDHVMPTEIAAFRARFSNVSFLVQARDHARAVAALIAHDAELALILQPPPMPELQTLFVAEIPICAIMSAGHALVGKGPIRLRDCLRFPLAMPDHSLSVRHSLDTAIVRGNFTVTIAVESGSIDFLRNYVLQESVVSFQVSTGLPIKHNGIVVREIDRHDLAPLHVALSHLRGRKLSSAASEFADQLARSLHR